MDFIYTEEQRMLADSLRRLVDQEWAFARRRARQAATALDPQAWASLAELGVLGLNIGQDYGGFGEVPASLLPVHVELGRGLVSEPVIPSAVMSAALVDAAGGPARERWLPRIASGEAILSVAYQEPGRRYDARPQDCRAAPQGGGWRLDGAKHLVWHGGAATAWLVSARAEDGETLLLAVPSDTAGVRITDTPTLDRARCARLDFDGAALPADALLARGEAAGQALAQALQWGTAALCAHAAGAMERLLEITADYLRTRKQFGQPLASFQALQHKLAEMLELVENSHAAVYYAAWALDADAADAALAASVAKSMLNESSKRVCGEAIQVHGGIGYTWEYDLHLYWKRAKHLEPLYGDTVYHRERVLEESLAQHATV